MSRGIVINTIGLHTDAACCQNSTGEDDMSSTAVSAIVPQRVDLMMTYRQQDDPVLTE
jgi:hypothetical protein